MKRTVIWCGRKLDPLTNVMCMHNIPKHIILHMCFPTILLSTVQQSSFSLTFICVQRTSMYAMHVKFIKLSVTIAQLITYIYVCIVFVNMLKEFTRHIIHCISCTCTFWKSNNCGKRSETKILLVGGLVERLNNQDICIHAKI